MNIESFPYAILAAVMGMAIVFAFLIILSGLMRAIRELFADTPSQPAATVAPSSSASALPSSGAAPSAHWLIPAVAAYLQAEAADEHPDAEPWVSGRPQFHTPWVSLPGGEQ